MTNEQVEAKLLDNALTRLEAIMGIRVIHPSAGQLEYDAELLQGAINALSRVLNVVEYGSEVYRLRDKLIVSRDALYARIPRDTTHDDEPLF